MKGALLLEVNNQDKLLITLNSLFSNNSTLPDKFFYVHSDRKLSKISTLDSSLKYLKPKTLIVSSLGTEKLDYVSKNSTIVSYSCESSTNEQSDDNIFSMYYDFVNVFSKDFIEAQHNFEATKNFSLNFKDHFLNTYDTNFTLCFNYFSSNTRPFVALANHYGDCYKPETDEYKTFSPTLVLFLVKSEDFTFIFWTTKVRDYLDNYLLPENYNLELNTFIHSIYLGKDSLLILHPLHIQAKYDKWRRVELRDNVNIVLPNLINYLNKITVV